MSTRYVAFAMSAKGLNDAGADARLTKIREIKSKHNPVNGGDMKTENIFMQKKGVIFEETREISIVHGVFTNLKDLVGALRDVRKADLGISVVVSGLFDDTTKAATGAGCRCHTAEYSSRHLWKNRAPTEGEGT